MSSTNIIGNLTRDPELRYTAGGRGVASAGVASNRKWKDKNGDWQEQVSFFNVVAWGELGENWAASCKKGDRIVVVGRLEQRSYDTKEGEKRSVVEVVADSIGADLRYATVQVEKTERSSYKDTPAQPEQAVQLMDEEPF